MTRKCLVADTPLPVGSWGQTKPKFLNPTCQFSDVFWTAVVSLTVVLCAVWFLHPPDSHAWMTFRQNAQKKKPDCLYLSSNIHTIREEKQVFHAWYFYCNEICFTMWRILRLSLKWRSLNWVEDEQEHQREAIRLRERAIMVLSKWKCSLCNKI